MFIAIILLFIILIITKESFGFKIQAGSIELRLAPVSSRSLNKFPNSYALGTYLSQGIPLYSLSILDLKTLTPSAFI